MRSLVGRLSFIILTTTCYAVLSDVLDQFIIPNEQDMRHVLHIYVNINDE